MKIEVNTKALDSRTKNLLDAFRTKKMAHLWRPIAHRMRKIYTQMYAKDWPHLANLSQTYLSWKKQKGYPMRKLEASGRMRRRLTKAGGPILPGSNEGNLMLGTGKKVVTNTTGQWERPHKNAPMKYPNALATGFTTPHPYGYKQNSPTRVRGRNYLWHEPWRPDVVQEGGRFAHKMAKAQWGNRARRID